MVQQFDIFFKLLEFSHQVLGRILGVYTQKTENMFYNTFYKTLYLAKKCEICKRIV